MADKYLYTRVGFRSAYEVYTRNESGLREIFLGTVEKDDSFLYPHWRGSNRFGAQVYGWHRSRASAAASLERGHGLDAHPPQLPRSAV